LYLPPAFALLICAAITQWKSSRTPNSEMIEQTVGGNSILEEMMANKKSWR
jgi:hypothetical protein